MPALRTLGEAQSYRAGIPRDQGGPVCSGRWEAGRTGRVRAPGSAVDIVAIGGKLLRSPARGLSLGGGSRGPGQGPADQ